MSAINSNIDHKEVKILKGMFFIFMLLLLTICVLDYVEVNRQF